MSPKNFEEQFLDSEITLNKNRQLEILITDNKYENESNQNLEKQFRKEIEKIKVI